jgi:hypothetical protein
MTTEIEEYVWRIGSQSIGVGDVASPHMLNAIRVIPDDEREKLESASVFLGEVSENSPFKSFEDKYFEFNQYIADVANSHLNSKDQMVERWATTTGDLAPDLE